MRQRFLGIVTVGRSDYGIYRSILDAIRKQRDLAYGLYVGGAHLAPQFGRTLSEIQRHGHPVTATVEMVAEDDSETAMAGSMARGIEGFCAAFAGKRPDLVVVLGDRYEMFAAAIAASIQNIPIAHIHGGEVSEGAMDNAFRHSISKFSHFHFASTALSARRLGLMGEDPAHIYVTGAPALDNLAVDHLLGRKELSDQFGVPVAGDFLLVTYHPETLEPGSARDQILTIIAALEEVGMPMVFTLANADPGGRAINAEIRNRVASTPGMILVENFGLVPFFSAMSQARAMVGNSSSGIIEAASFRLPVVNIGSRQAGRERSANVLDAECTRDAIRGNLNIALSASFREKLTGLVNLYGDGSAAPKIVEIIKSVPLNAGVLKKQFHFSAAEDTCR